MMLTPFLTLLAPSSLCRTFKEMLEFAHQTLSRYSSRHSWQGVCIHLKMAQVREASTAVSVLVMGRALAINSREAKKIEIPTNMIAIDLYLQCKILEMGRDIIYNDNAIVYFKPANNIHDLASQVMRAVNGHNQIEDYVSLFSIGLP